MPKTSTLLTAEERKGFGEWLDATRKSLKLSRRGLLENLGRSRAGSTAEINGYLTGHVIPTAATLESLATVLELPLRSLLMRAGLLTPLLTEMADLLCSARAICAEDGVEFSSCTSPVTSERAVRRLSGARYMHADVPSWDRFASPFVMPWQGVVAAYIAIVAFPLRGEERTGNTYLWDADSDVTVRHRGRLPRELTLAADLLDDSAMEPDARRAAAGECVRQWVRREFGEFALAVERASYENSLSLPHLFAAERGAE